MPPDQNPQYINPQQYLQSKKSPKKWIIGGLLTILILVGIVVTTNLALTQKIFKGRASELDEIQAELQTLTTVSEASQESHPELFLAILEYDPDNGAINQLNQDYIHGDPQPLFAEKPNDESSLYNFRLDSISEQGEILTSGWLTVYKEIAQRSDGKVVFNISLYYTPKSTVNLYSSGNQLIWTIQTKDQE